MSIEAREIHRQEQTLLACAEMLRQTEKTAAGLCDDMTGLETGDETFGQLGNAVKQAAVDMKREAACMEKLAQEISEAGAQLRAQEALLKESSLWSGEETLF